jgi:quinol monooxygenase YgiN
MLALSRFRVRPEDEAGFRADVADALRALGARPGFVAGHVGRSTDDPGLWLLSTEWTGAGAYRRALSSYDVKLRATGLFHRAEQEPGAYEVVETFRPGTGTTDAPADAREG